MVIVRLIQDMLGFSLGASSKDRQAIIRRAVAWRNNAIDFHDVLCMADVTERQFNQLYDRIAAHRESGKRLTAFTIRMMFAEICMDDIINRGGYMPHEETYPIIF